MEFHQRRYFYYIFYLVSIYCSCSPKFLQKIEVSQYLIVLFWIIFRAKVGIRNLSPHLRNSAILRTTKSIAELRTKKSCGTTIADLQNLTSAIPQLCSLRQVPYFIVIFPKFMMLQKSTINNFYNRLFQQKPKTWVKGIVARDFLASDFFSWSHMDSWFIP
jgi:hypothetical protein